ncbi:MAG: hypothetical protein RLZZ480_159, partial [Candidatus Parcubacteria bacterium]
MSDGMFYGVASAFLFGVAVAALLPMNVWGIFLLVVVVGGLAAVAR